MNIINILAICVAGLSSVACTPEDLSLSVSSKGIVGGELAPGDPAVVAIEFPQNEFTGVLIRPRVVLTIAHGLDQTVNTDAVTQGLVRFGSNVESPDLVIGTEDARIHRYFDLDDVVNWDVGLVLLAEDAPVAPLPVAAENLDAFLEIGDEARIVGFGRTSAGVNDYGIKRQVTVPVVQVNRHIVTLVGPGGACNGDSGSPNLVVIDGVETVVGLTSRTNCGTGTTSASAAVYMSSFIVPTLDRWEGPCRLDGVCVEEGCRTPDPDCDECGFNDLCGEGCATLDLDCPIRARVGDACEVNEDCESELCVQSPSYPGNRYCTLPCSAAWAPVICEDAQECTDVAELGQTVCLTPFVPTNSRTAMLPGRALCVWCV